MNKVERRTTSLSNNFDKMRHAFHEYDIKTFQELNDAQQEVLVFLPLNELGPKTDFLFTDNNIAKTLAKHVFSKIGAKGMESPDLLELVLVTVKTCLSGYLRAHLHITRKQDAP